MFGAQPRSLQQSFADLPTSINENDLTGISAQLPEIILCIADFLGPEHIAALSLTSKRFYEQLFARAQRRLWHDQEARLRFLHIIEIESPHLLACAACNKLYRWKCLNLYWWLPNEHNCRRWDLSNHAGDVIMCADHQVPVHMSIEVRDLILRASIRGAEHGLPLGHLGQHYDDRNSKEYLDMQTTLQPRIVHGSLMMHRLIELSINLQKPLMPQLDRMAVPVCDHEYARMQAIVLCALSHILDLPSLPPRDVHKRCSQKLLCSWCATDFKIKLIDKDTKVIVQTEIWQDFGSRTCSNQAIKNHFAPHNLRWNYPWSGRDPVEAQARDLCSKYESIYDMGRKLTTEKVSCDLIAGIQRYDMKLWYLGMNNPHLGNIFRGPDDYLP